MTDFRQRAIEKLAFYGPASVWGTPIYFAPQMTVGQTMTNINANPTLSPFDRRRALDQIVSTGIDVNSPAKKLIGAGLGAFAGNLVGKALGMGTFGRAIASLAGAHYGTRY